jgi:Type I phosphodiesterase / nucleotide pyrophosphatase
MIIPDYQGGSIVNLMATIVKAMGGEESRYPPLRVLPPAALTGRNVVLLVIDGMGYENLTANGRGALAQHLKDRITSVFPSTTAAAITTFYTGAAPQQHAISGWFTYFRELGSVIAPLPYRPRHGGSVLTVPATTLFEHVPVFDRLRARSYAVSPERIAYSEFSKAHNGTAEVLPFATLAQMFEAVGRVVRTPGERRYFYAYWPELDRLAHEYGIASREALAHLEEIDAAFGAFLGAIAGTDTTVIVTADHGFIDTPPQEAIVLDDHPALEQALVLPLCGEPRAAFCYVHADKRRQFADYVTSRLSEYAELCDSKQLIESGFFGLGPPHPRLLERIGDYTLLMKRDANIKDWLLGEKRYVHVGVHGGTSAREMYVPLVVTHA